MVGAVATPNPSKDWNLPTLVHEKEYLNIATNFVEILMPFFPFIIPLLLQ